MDRIEFETKSDREILIITALRINNLCDRVNKQNGRLDKAEARLDAVEQWRDIAKGAILVLTFLVGSGGLLWLVGRIM